MRWLWLSAWLLLVPAAPAQILLEWDASTNTSYSVDWGGVTNGVRSTNTGYSVYLTNKLAVKWGYVAVPLSKSATRQTFWVRVRFYGESGEVGLPANFEYSIPVRGPRLRPVFSP